MHINGYPRTPSGHSAAPADNRLALSTALAAGDEDKVRALLARDPALIHGADRHGETVLHMAVHADCSAELVRSLLQAGAGPMRVNGNGDTALHIAAARSPGDPEVVSALLSAGGLALADRTDRHGRSALERARRYGTAAVVDRLISDIHLLERCADWRDSPCGPLWRAFADALDDAPLSTLMLPLASLGGVDAADGRGMTVLMRAADAGRADLVAWLMEQGATVNTTCHCKRTGVTVSALMFALPFPAVTRLLLAWGADPMQAHRLPARWLDRPQTVLHVAAAGAAQDSMSALLAACARSAWHDADLGAAMLAALRNSAPQLAFAILEYGGKPDARTMREAMPLAVASGNHEVVHLLLALGADANARDADGGTVLDIAVERGDDAMAVLLADHGAATRRTTYPRARRLPQESCLLQ